MPNKGYFQPQQAREVAETFAKRRIEYMFIGKSGAILLGYPSTTQDVDLFPKKSEENCRRLITALREIGFDLSPKTEDQIIRGVDFVQINQDPFDLDLIFAPDGIESFEKAQAIISLILTIFRLPISEVLSPAKRLRAEKKI